MQIEGAHLEGKCYFINNDKDVWHRANFHFVGEHVLQLSFANADGTSVVIEVDNKTYDLQQFFAGSEVDSVNKKKDWKPANKTPGINEEQCFIETLSAFPTFPNQTGKVPVLWLQFPTINDFCKFYEYWNMNVRKKNKRATKVWRAAFLVYERFSKEVGLERPLSRRNPQPVFQAAILNQGQGAHVRRQAVLVQQAPETNLEGDCYFMKIEDDVWHRATFHFVRNHVLKLSYTDSDGSFVTTEGENDIYNLEQFFVGSDTDWLNAGRRFRPANETPGIDGEQCAAETFSAFQNRTPAQPVLWLQFPTSHDFCNFYRYWNRNVRTTVTPENLWRASFEIYKNLKARLSPRPNLEVNEEKIAELLQQIRESSVYGKCYFMKNENDAWQQAMFYFIKNHVLKVLYVDANGVLFMTEVRHQVYKLSRMYVVSAVLTVNGKKGDLAISIIFYLNSNFYEYWNNYVRRGHVETEFSKASFEWYKTLKSRNPQQNQGAPAPEPVVVVQQIHEAFIHGECCFISNDENVWHWATFYFIENHVLKLSYVNPNGGFIITEGENTSFNLERIFVGTDVDSVNGRRGWKPANRTPGKDEKQCAIETFSAFPNKKTGHPVLWLQFPTIKDFCSFYGYWYDNVLRRQGPIDSWRDSFRWYESLKKRLHESNQRANEQ